MELDYCTIIDELLRRFPEAENNVKQDCLDLPHVVFESGVIPIIKESLKNSDTKTQQMFSFLEEMALSTDEEVRNLLLVSGLEALADDGSVRELAKAQMGEATYKLYLELGTYMRNI